MYVATHIMTSLIIGMILSEFEKIVNFVNANAIDLNHQFKDLDFTDLPDAETAAGGAGGGDGLLGPLTLGGVRVAGGAGGGDGLLRKEQRKQKII